MLVAGGEIFDRQSLFRRFSIMCIWKFELTITDLQSVEMPSKASILHVDNQRGVLCIWAIADPQADYESRTIEIVGTNQHLQPCESRVFLGTVIDEPFVWHVFERT